MAIRDPLPAVLDNEEVRHLANDNGMPGQGEYWTWTEARHFAWCVEQAVLRKVAEGRNTKDSRPNLTSEQFQREYMGTFR